jgi:ABC-type lipopolysaccharide export system ATPase subunit
LDEPFAGIDPIAVEDIQVIVAKLKHKNIGILVTDHNVHETLSIVDRAYLLFEGKILKLYASCARFKYVLAKIGLSFEISVCQSLKI